MIGNIYLFEVTGSGEFPTSLLADQSCFPKTTEDAYNAFEFSSSIRTISLKSIKIPNVDLWRSYGWSISGLPDSLFQKEDYTKYHTWPC
jgi:hypothetical protein